MAVTDDEEFGRRTQTGVPAAAPPPYYLARPGAPSQPPPKYVDRVGWAQQQKQRALQAQQAEFRRQQAEAEADRRSLTQRQRAASMIGTPEEARFRAGLGDILSAESINQDPAIQGTLREGYRFAERQRAARQQQQTGGYEPGQYADPATEAYARQMAQAQPGTGGFLGGVSRLGGQIQDIANAPLTGKALDIARATNPLGLANVGLNAAGLPTTNDILRTDIPDAIREPGIRALTEAQRFTPAGVGATVGLAADILRRVRGGRGPSSGELRQAIAEGVFPRELWEVAIEFVPQIGTVDDIARAARAGNPEALAAVRAALAQSDRVGAAIDAERAAWRNLPEFTETPPRPVAIETAPRTPLDERMGRFRLTTPGGDRLDYRLTPGGGHIADVTVQTEGRGTGTALLNQAVDDIRRQNPGALITGDLNSESGARLFARQPGAEFADLRGATLTPEDAIAAAGRGEGPQVTLRPRMPDLEADVAASRLPSLPEDEGALRLSMITAGAEPERADALLAPPSTKAAQPAQIADTSQVYSSYNPVRVKADDYHTAADFRVGEHLITVYDSRGAHPESFPELSWERREWGIRNEMGDYIRYDEKGMDAGFNDLLEPLRFVDDLIRENPDTQFVIFPATDRLNNVYERLFATRHPDGYMFVDRNKIDRLVKRLNRVTQPKGQLREDLQAAQEVGSAHPYRNAPDELVQEHANHGVKAAEEEWAERTAASPDEGELTEAESAAMAQRTLAQVQNAAPQISEHNGVPLRVIDVTDTMPPEAAHRIAQQPYIKQLSDILAPATDNIAAKAKSLKSPTFPGGKANWKDGRFGGITLNRNNLAENHATFRNPFNQLGAAERAGLEEFSQRGIYINPFGMMRDMLKLTGEEPDPEMMAAWLANNIAHEVAHNFEITGQDPHGEIFSSLKDRVTQIAFREIDGLRAELRPALDGVIKDKAFWSDFGEWQGYADKQSIGSPFAGLVESQGGAGVRGAGAAADTGVPPLGSQASGTGGGGPPGPLAPTGAGAAGPQGVGPAPAPGRYPEAPDLRQPDLTVSPAEELTARKGAASGGAVRRLGELIRRVDDLAASHTGDKGSAARSFTDWISKDSGRFDSPADLARSDWQRNRESIQTWAEETGTFIQRDLEPQFGQPNDVFVATDGQPIFYKLPDGPNEGKQVKLTNRDAVENYDLLQAKMTPEQFAVAEELGKYMRASQYTARQRGVKYLGTAENLAGDPVQSYVHRTVVSAPGEEGRIYRSEFGSQGPTFRAGAKITEENPRDYTTAAEGLLAGNTYANTWGEEYGQHLRQLKNREADLYLKQTTDRLSQTMGERIDEIAPGLRERYTGTRSELKRAETAIRRTQDQVRRRALVQMRREVTQAKRAVQRAERRLAEETVAPRLMGARRERLVMQVGKAREELAQSTSKLRGLNEETLHLLRGKYSDEEKQLIDAAKLKVEEIKEERKGLREELKGVRAQAQPSIREKLQPGGLPITAGRVFKLKDANVLERLNAEPGQGWLGNALYNFSQPMRWTLAILDASFFGNQGWNTLIMDTPGFAAAIVRSSMASLSPERRRQMILGAPDAVKWLQTNAPHVWDANPDFEPRGNLVATATRKLEDIPVAGKGMTIAAFPFRFTDSLFRNSRTFFSLQLAKLMMDDAKTADEAYELGSAIGNLVGVNRTVGGEKGVLFAASFFRSQFSQMFNALSNGGLQGAKAREFYLKLFTKASLVTLAGAIFLDGERDPRKLAERINPLNPNSFQIQGVSLLGQWRPMVRMFSDLGQKGVEATRNNDPRAFADAMASEVGGEFLRAKANPLIAKLINSSTGEDFLGRPTSFQEEFNPFSTKQLPLSIQQSIQNVQGGADPTTSIFAAFTGLRYLPDTRKEQLEQQLSAGGYDVDRYFQEPGYRYTVNQESPSVQGANANWEQSRREGSVEQRKKQKIVDDARTHINNKIGNIQEGEAGTAELREYVQAEATTKRILFDALGDADTESNSPLEPLWQAFEDARDPGTGEIDFDKAFSDIESQLQQHPELRERWEQQQFVPITNNPVEQELRAGQRLVAEQVPLGDEQINYFGVNQYVWEQVAGPILEEYPTPGDYQLYFERIVRNAGGDPDDALSKNPLWKKQETGVQNLHDYLLKENPEKAAALAVFYDVNMPQSRLTPQQSAVIAVAIKRLYQKLGIKPPD